MFAIDNFIEEMQKFEYGLVFKLVWEDHLFSAKSCIRHQKLTDFNNLCGVDKNVRSAEQDGCV